MERGELPGALQGFAPSRPRALGIRDEVELLLEMPPEIEGETKDEWFDRRATIIKVEARRFLVHCEAGHGVSDKVDWIESGCVRRAPRSMFGYSTPRHGGLPLEDTSAARQVEIWVALMNFLYSCLKWGILLMPYGYAVFGGLKGVSGRGEEAQDRAVEPH